MTIAFFDFDGTITYKDSFIDFLKFYKKSNYKLFFDYVILLPFFILYFFKLLSRDEIKEKILTRIFKGVRKDSFLEVTKKYSLECIDAFIIPTALDQINKHIKQGDTVVIVSASLSQWLAPWCKKHNINLIATEIEFINDIATGKLYGKNCYGIEKVNKIKQQYCLDNFDQIYAYGNSRGDHEMLEIAHKKYYKYFN